MKTILVIDDSSIILKTIKKLLSDDYKVVGVTSAIDGLDFLRNNMPDLILLDILMPDMDGFELASRLKSDYKTADIPIIFLTADTSSDREVEGFRLGAADFIVKPIRPEIVRSRIDRTLELEQLRKNLKEEVDQKTKEIEVLTLQAMRIVSNVIDAKGDFSSKNSFGVACIAEKIAKRMGFTPTQLTNVRYVALLHDIGRVGIPDAIINKKTKFTPQEYEVVKKHCEIGAEIMGNVTIPNVRDGALYHHERYDGTGYPHGLKGTEIPLVARILSVADAYQAMTNDRAYRKHLTMDCVVEEFQKERGKQFDPGIVDIILDLISCGEQFIYDEERDSLLNNHGIMTESARLLQKVMTEYTSEVRDEANKDTLTGLWNRKYTIGKVNELLKKHSNQGAVFMLDIDNFKGINDSYGHIFGDEILINISRVIMEMVRQNDIGCRLGGDEFMIYLNGISDAATAGKIASRLIKTLNTNVRYPDNVRGVCTSVGIALAPTDGINFDELYSSSDKALYQAKNSGKNIFCFYDDINEEDETVKEIKNDLEYIRARLGEKEPMNGSFCVGYEEFKNIAQYIRRSIVRNKRNVVYILFTTEFVGQHFSTEKMNAVMSALENSVKTLLRVGDVVTRYSNTQILAILMDSNEENAEIVAGRVCDDFGKNQICEGTSLEFAVQQLENSAE